MLELYGEPTATFILIAVKALLKSEAPHAAILTMIADLEAVGEHQREEAKRRLDRTLLESDFKTMAKL